MIVEHIFNSFVEAILKCLWWWFWYGIVSEILGTAWGFAFVFVLTFASQMYKALRDHPTCGEATP